LFFLLFLTDCDFKFGGMFAIRFYPTIRFERRNIWNHFRIFGAKRRRKANFVRFFLRMSFFFRTFARFLYIEIEWQEY